MRLPATPEQDAEILKASETVAIVRSGNFSLGVNILIGLVEHAAQRLDAADWDIEVLETHHRRKADAPSGTALMLGEAAASGRGEELADVRTPPYDGIGARETGENARMVAAHHAHADDADPQRPLRV